MSAPEIFTGRLNAALSTVMQDKSQPDAVRYWLCIQLHSWGNWYPYAVQGTNQAPGIPPVHESREAIRALVFGAGPCPFCGKTAKHGKEGMPRNWRWHVTCMGTAYAEDAVRFGDETQRAWGETFLKGEFTRIKDNKPLIPAIRKAAKA